MCNDNESVFYITAVKFIVTDSHKQLFFKEQSSEKKAMSSTPKITVYFQTYK